MQYDWRVDQPIYRQLRDKVIGLILEKVFKEGDAVPSVRHLSAEHSINHLTVSKAYQELVDQGLLIKKRGIGMFVVEGARQKLLAKERKKFMQAELPFLLSRIQQLGISTEEIINAINTIKDDT